MPTVLAFSEGNMEHGVKRKSCFYPARAETLRMSGSDLRESWEVLAVPGAIRAGGAGKVNNRNPAINAAEKSDTPIVSKKPPSKGQLAEAVEGRGVAKGNAGETPTSRTQGRKLASKGLEGVREVARREKTHLYPEQRFCVTYPRQEPCAVIPPAGICAGGRG